MHISVPIAIATLCTLAGCKADDDASGPGGLCDSADAPADCCMVDADCKRTCPAGDRCLCAIRHEQAGHCYSDCPLEEKQVTDGGAACTDYFAGWGCSYDSNGKLDLSKSGCGYYPTSEGWVFIDCDFAATCAKTGGTQSSAMCCGDATDFPDSYADLDFCGCDKDASTAKVKVCKCPEGMRFSRVKGCHVSP
jgi:hypothetical protein